MCCVSTFLQERGAQISLLLWARLQKFGAFIHLFNLKHQCYNYSGPLVFELLPSLDTALIYIGR
jgi:hypothetical protein